MRRGLGLLVALTLLLASLPVAANPSLNPREALEQGHNAYDRGDYRHAIDTLQPLLYPAIELGTEEEVVMAHRLLALSYFFVNKQKEAEEEVTSLLVLRPNYELDPIVDPPVAVRFFEDVRKHQADRLRAIEKREREERERSRREEERRSIEQKARAQRIYVDRVVEHHSRLIALLPFGIGQFQNGHKVKGALFAAGELALGAVSIGTWAALTFDPNYPIDPSTQHRTFPRGDLGRVTGLLITQLVAGGAFYALVAAGIVDAQVYFKREVVRVEHERPTAAPLPPKKRATSLILTPLYSPTMTGVGVQGTF